MKAETQRELLRLCRNALTLLSADCSDREFVFEFRDVLKKAESETGEHNESDAVH
jgi:hypothetical protein